jgi:hypothetical protein
MPIDISIVAAGASVHSVRDRVAALFKAGTDRNFLKRILNFVKYEHHRLWLFSCNTITWCAVGFSGSQSIRFVEESGEMPFPEARIFAPGVEAAWSALQRQYAGQISEAEIDYLLACFVFGLTTPAYANQEPSLHFEVCRALVSIKLPPDRADAALYAVPVPTQAGVESARELVESKGVKMGRALLDERSDPESFSTGKVSFAASARLGGNEGNVQ